ncbi:hypothetical protein CMI37_32130 [Candidatus Pacearchaeota archaeon]|jgi:hypothetical protein|nr:hypothetical protein [Candidatus Pacearchaeota archaeon]
MQGFAVNDADVTGITTSFVLGKAILIHTDTTADAKSSALPQSCYLSHIDIQLDATSGSPTKAAAILAWDSDGDDPMTGVSQGNPLWQGMTDTSLRNTSIALDTWVTAPTGQTTAGKCYLWIKVDAGTVTLKKARLHWAARRTI